ncbi:MAG: LamG-like jellyroll fold domain-containing protein [Nanoarchaeota archaeon]|nr:LamG-like jellyroll fold domain-containing protein [Nanoarchaeota archaeon]
MENKNSGFTLIEVLVGLAIVAVLSTVGVLNLTSFRASRSVRANMEELESAAQDARERSRTQEEGFPWGMRFSNMEGSGTYELFRGSSYNPGAVRRTNRLSSGVVFSEPHAGSEFDASFGPVSGGLSATKVISLTHPGVATLVGDVVLSALGSVAARVHTGILGYWHFDETGGASLFDVTPAGRDATLEAGALRSLSCRAGGCVSFDGVNDYLSGNFSGKLSEFTISGWVYQTGFGNSGSLFSAYLGSSGVLYGRFLAASRKPSFFTLSSEGASDELTAPDQVSLNAWHHLAYVYDGTIKRIYVDGREAASASFPGAKFSFDNFEIGRSERSPGKVFQGTLDEVRFYGRALEPSEVREVYEELR